jgi:hypothetical protein
MFGILKYCFRFTFSVKLLYAFLTQHPIFISTSAMGAVITGKEDNCETNSSLKPEQLVVTANRLWAGQSRHRGSIPKRSNIYSAHRVIHLTYPNGKRKVKLPLRLTN